MNELIYSKSFNEWESELNTELTKSAESFVRIGYLLKVARDTDILKDSGYANIVEYARDKYGIDKTQVSRFININDRFSEGGNSPELKTQYKGFGYAKLAIMLQLPDEINEELTPDYSKSEINAIKSELDEESKISDLEVLCEGKDEAAAGYSELEQIIYKICEDDTEVYTRLHRALTTDEGVDVDNVVELFAPSGGRIYSIRLQGVGRVAVSFKVDESYVSTINMRTNEKNRWSLDDLYKAVIKVLDTPETDVKQAWQQLYARPWPVEPEPEKAKVAPVQPKNEAPKKEKKVVKAKVDKPAPEKEAPPEDPSIENAPSEIDSNALKSECEADFNEPIDTTGEYVEDSVTENAENVTETLESDTKTSESVSKTSESVSKISDNIMNPPADVNTEDKPDFEADMAAVDSPEESELEIRNNIIAMALNIANVLQDRADEDKIPTGLLDGLMRCANNIVQQFGKLVVKYESTVGKENE